MRDPSEDELDGWMARLAEGERDAFDPLFRALHPRAVRLARLELPDDLAADAAQSMLMKVFARASEFHAGRPALPWFYGIAANELRSLGRRRTRERHRYLAAEHGAEVAGPDDPERLFIEQELRGALARAIATLDEESAGAIAAMLNERQRPLVSESAFRKRVSRAYARLRLLLGGFDAG